MPDRPIYADASPLIGLARIDRLDIVRALPIPVRVTEQVWEEVTASPDRPGAQRLREAERSGLIVVVREGGPGEYPSLDAGKAATISAAREAGGAVIIDEQRARRLLESDPTLRSRVPYMTTAALLVRARRQGQIPSVRQLLDRLREESFPLRVPVNENTLEAARQWPTCVRPHDVRLFGQSRSHRLPLVGQRGRPLR